MTPAGGLIGKSASLTAEERAKFLPLCPDFVIELRSPTDGLSALQEKMREYMENGAQLDRSTTTRFLMRNTYRVHPEPAGVPERRSQCS